MGHADGMLMFTDANTLFVNRYEEPFHSNLLQILKTDLPQDIKIIEIESQAVEKKFDNFYSACGIYVNSLVTKKYIYMPLFGFELDKKNLELVQNNSNKQVVPIDAQDVCFMGGSVRCLSWQLSGDFAYNFLQKIKNTTQIHTK